MPVPTPELGLSQAVDADDTADYLVTNLANSLVTVDATFNNVSGHTHGGVHQGGPISSIPASAIPLGSITSAMIADGTIQAADIAAGAITSAKISPPIDIPGMFRTTGSTGEGAGPSAIGPGMELFYTGTFGAIQGFDRSSSLYLPIEIIASKITLSASGGTNVVIDTSGNVQMAGTLAVSGAATLTGGAVFSGGSTLVGGGTNMYYEVPAGGQHLFEYTAGGYAPVSTGNLTVNGALNATGTVTIGGALTANATTTINAGLTVNALAVNGVATVAQLDLASANQFITPVGASIRYATAAGGGHSFEFAAGGSASVECASILLTGAANSGSGQLSFGNQVGQGTAGTSVLPVGKGTGFGPSALAGKGWVQFSANGVVAYFPYWT